MWYFKCLLALGICVVLAVAYDPDDKEIETIIPTPGTFEAFYPRETNGTPNANARAPHNHGSFFNYRNPGEILIHIFLIHSNFSKRDQQKNIERKKLKVNESSFVFKMLS